MYVKHLSLSLPLSRCVCVCVCVFTLFLLRQVLLKLISFLLSRLALSPSLSDSEDFASPGATSHQGGRRREHFFLPLSSKENTSTECDTLRRLYLQPVRNELFTKFISASVQSASSSGTPPPPTSHTLQIFWGGKRKKKLVREGGSIAFSSLLQSY